MISFGQDQNSLACDFHKQLFKKKGVRYNVVKEAPNIETAVFYVTMNEGSFILPDHLSHMAKGNVILPLTDDHCFITLNLVWKKNNVNPALPIFCKMFTKFMQPAI